MSGVDVGGHAETEHDDVLTVEHQGAIDDVDEQVDVGRVGKVTHHGFEHQPDQFDPAQLVEEVQRAQFLSPAQFRLALNNAKEIKHEAPS